MDLGIVGKVALVTGAGRGIGAAICEALVKEGVKVIAVSRSSSGLEELKCNLGPSYESIHTIELDLSLEESLPKLFKQLQNNVVHPDIIVNNLGGNLSFTDPLGPVSEWRQVMNVNVEVAIEINRHFIPLMQKNKWGRVCHISSIAALENQGPPSYCAAKAALNAYVRSLGRYVAADNVILTSLMPGAIFTKDGYWDIASKERPEHVKKYLDDRMAIKRFGSVEEISKLATFLCSEYASFCVGSAILADGGQGRCFQNS